MPGVFLVYRNSDFGYLARQGLRLVTPGVLAVPLELGYPFVLFRQREPNVDGALSGKQQGVELLLPGQIDSGLPEGALYFDVLCGTDGRGPRDGWGSD